MLVAVTGATGIVGRFVVERLAREGARIRALVRPTSDRRELPPGVEWVVGGMTDSSALSGLLDAGLKATPEAYARLERLRAAFRTGLEDVLGTVDAIIAPCMTGPIPPAERLGPPRRPVDPGRSMISFTAPFDYSGHPTITLPLALDADGMPRAFQLVGPLLGEDRLIGVASAFEAAAGFTYPTLEL